MKVLGYKIKFWSRLALSVLATSFLITPSWAAPTGTIYNDVVGGNVSYAGSSWTHSTGWSKACLDGVSWTNHAGDTASLSFTGQSITRVYTMGPNRGTTEIFVDGVSQGNPMSDYSAYPVWQAARTWSFPQGSSHIITIKALAGSNYYTDVDCFIADIYSASYGMYDDQWSVTYVGNWTYANNWPSAYNSTVSWTNDPGSGITFNFTGDVVTYYYTKASNRGTARVVIDGIIKGDLNLYSATPQWQQSTTYSALGSGIHTINITKIDSSTSTFVDVDAMKVGALSTQLKCDSVPKYYCSIVAYVQNPDSRTITYRWYSGGRDGGAQWWELQYTKDQELINNTWQTVEEFPSPGTQTNISMSAFAIRGPQRTRAVNSRVLMLFHFYECTPSSGCYDWYSPINQHNL